MRPDILLLDEPMSALDAQSRLAISDDIYKIIKNEGITAIMVTHDIAEAVSMSDKVIVLTKRPAVIKKIYEINLENSFETNKDKGRAGMALGIAWFGANGYTINIPLNDT